MAACLITLLAGVLVVLLAVQVKLELTEILFPENTWLQGFLMISLALLLISIAHVLIYVLVDQKAIRLVLALILTTIVSTIPLFGGTVFVTFVLLSASLGLFVAQIGNYSGLRGLWSFLGKIRNVGALTVFILVLLVAYSNPAPFQNSFKRMLITFALSQAAPSANLADAVDKLIPETVDENELQHLREALRAQYPNYDTLPPEVQKQMEEEMIESYIRVKRQIKAALRETFSKVDPETLTQQLGKSIQTMPLFQQIIRYAGVLYALAASFIYTLTSWLASILAFVIGIPIWKRKSEKIDKELVNQ